MDSQQLNLLNQVLRLASDREVPFSTSFNRPANVTPYAAEDAVNDGTSNLTFTPVGGDATKAGFMYYIKSLRVVTNNATITNGAFRLYILNTTQTPVIADNAQQTLLFANIDKVIGFIDFSLTTGGTGSDAAEAYITDIDIPVVLTGSRL